MSIFTQLTKEIDENSDLKIPFSKKTFVAVLVFAIVEVITVVMLA